ncbi:hypothetical protein GF367_00865, partial [Candidatus Woesearchaeota archaeon]|nr:hypothetical protein [Candidatus Woesearchaeota archaeon]
MNKDTFSPLQAFRQYEKQKGHANIGQGLEGIVHAILSQFKPLKKTIHDNFNKHPEQPHFTAEDLEPWIRDQVIPYLLKGEEDYRHNDLTRWGPRSGILHPLNLVFLGQTLNATDEELIERVFHDHLEDIPKTLKEFDEYYCTG